MRRIPRITLAVGLTIFIAYVTYAWWDRRAYADAVREDAERRGFPVAQIQYPAHWPLDYYLPRLQAVQGPAEAENVVRDATSVGYHILPFGGIDSAALVQVFRFRIHRWRGAVQVIYINSEVRVEGADWLPRKSSQVSRERALEWFATKRRRY